MTKTSFLSCTETTATVWFSVHFLQFSPKYCHPCQPSLIAWHEQLSVFNAWKKEDAPKHQVGRKNGTDQTKMKGFSPFNICPHSVRETWFLNAVWKNCNCSHYWIFCSIFYWMTLDGLKVTTFDFVVVKKVTLLEFITKFSKLQQTTNK